MSGQTNGDEAARARIEAVHFLHPLGLTFVRSGGGEEGKRPLESWKDGAPKRSIEKLERLARQGNLSVVLKGSPYVVLDLDEYKAGGVEQSFVESLPRTVTVETPKGGRHLYFLKPPWPIGDSPKKALGRDVPNVDIKGNGVVSLPGSANLKTGSYYRFVDGLSPADIEIAAWPFAEPSGKPRRSPARPHLPRAGCLGYAAAAMHAEVQAVATAAEGSRNNRLNRAAFSLGQLVGGGELDEVGVHGRLLDAALKSGLEEVEAERTISSGLEAGQKEPRSAPSPAATTGHSKDEHADSRLPFPAHRLPEVLHKYVVTAARAINADASTIALPLLVAAGAAIGTTRRARIKESWKEPAVLWGAVVLRSGERKSPALDAALFAVRELQDAAFKSTGEDERLKRFIMTDTTVEAAAVLLRDELRGMLLARDELNAFFRSLDAYKRGSADAANWIEMYGARPAVIDRKTGDDKTIHVPRAAVWITGTIQPAVMREAMRGHLDNGLAARFLISSPPPRTRRFPHEDVPPGHRDEVRRVFTKLYALDFGTDEEPIDLPLDEDAYAQFVRWYDELGEHCECESPYVAAAGAKIEGAVARIALIFQMVKSVSGESSESSCIDGTSMLHAIELGWWFFEEAKSFYASFGVKTGTGDHVLPAMRLLAEKPHTPSELAKAAGSGVSKPAEAEAILDRLVEEGIAIRRDRPRRTQGGRPTTEFLLIRGAEDSDDETSAE